MSIQCQTSEVEPFSSESVPTLESLDPLDQQIIDSDEVNKLSQTLKSTLIDFDQCEKG